MADVVTYLEINGPAYLLNALRTLRSHLNDEHLSKTPACLDWIADEFPKAKSGVHPRGDLPQKLEAYKKWRADLIRAVKIATGEREDRALRDKSVDGWKQLLDAVKLHTGGIGILHPSRAVGLNSLADLARRNGVQPWDLSDQDTVDRLDRARGGLLQRPTLSATLRFLSEHRFIPEIAEVLAAGPVALLAPRRAAKGLPSHIEEFVEQIIHRASSSDDEVLGQACLNVVQSTVDRYRAAIRYHLSCLPHCAPHPQTGYLNPISDLNDINDPSSLFKTEHIVATLRHSAEKKDRKGALKPSTIAHYYSDLMAVVSRNSLADQKLYKIIKSSQFYRAAREEGQGMTAQTEAWCQNLLTNSDANRRFKNLHRILQAKAQDLLDVQKNRPLTMAEFHALRSMGVAAAASAIEFAGRPIRLSNVLGLRFKGPDANFFLPGRGKEEFSFLLTAESTKARVKQPLTVLSKALHGPQVLAWYLQNIRPLFEHAAVNSYLFPAVSDPSAGLDKRVFDRWFQRAATTAGLPMTFHNFRHGYATILLSENWNNLTIAADMLGNTPEVCRRNYAFIDKQEVYRTGQDILVSAAKKLK